MSTTAISTNSSGQPIDGTAGTTIGNVSQDQLGPTEFLNLLMDQLKYQDPNNPADPTQSLTQLAQMTSVEQQQQIAQSTAQSASANAVSSAVTLIGDSVTYIDQHTGKDVTGTVQSVQITSNGPTLTIGGVAGIAPSTITSVTAASGSSTAGSGSSAAAGGTGAS
jgi:flagellar basal-body rod modification protein FlgD